MHLYDHCWAQLIYTDKDRLKEYSLRVELSYQSIHHGRPWRSDRSDDQWMDLTDFSNPEELLWPLFIKGSESSQNQKVQLVLGKPHAKHSAPVPGYLEMSQISLIMDYMDKTSWQRDWSPLCQLCNRWLNKTIVKLLPPCCTCTLPDDDHSMIILPYNDFLYLS